MEAGYSIQEASRLIGVSTYTLRYWEKAFTGILEPPRTQGRQRRYDYASILTVKEIHRLLRVEGYSIRGARKKLEDSQHLAMGSEQIHFPPN